MGTKDVGSPQSDGSVQPDEVGLATVVPAYVKMALPLLLDADAQSLATSARNQ
jgi:hypothetical protein